MSANTLNAFQLSLLSTCFHWSCLLEAYLLSVSKTWYLCALTRHVLLSWSSSHLLFIVLRSPPSRFLWGLSASTKHLIPCSTEIHKMLLHLCFALLFKINLYNDGEPIGHKADFVFCVFLKLYFTYAPWCPLWGLNSQPWDQESHALLSEPARSPKAGFVFNQVPGIVSSSFTVNIQYVFVSVISDNTVISICYGSNLSNSLCSNEWNRGTLPSP